MTEYHNALGQPIGGVHVVEEPTGLQRWTLVRYADSRRALADERLSKDPNNAREELLRAGYLTGEQVNVHGGGPLQAGF